MSKFSDRFFLNPEDLELIESSLRHLMHVHSDKALSTDCEISQRKARSLNTVLGKLHNQKIFYSQVNRTGVPAG